MKIEKWITEYAGVSVGIITGLCLMVYFLLMRILGLAQIMELRLFNFIILLAGIVWSMRLHAKKSGNEYNYFQALGNGCTTVVIAVLIFASFIAIYLSCDVAMMTLLKKHSLMGNFLNPESAAIGVFVEGASSGMILSYILLSYFSKSPTKSHSSSA